MEMWAGGHYYSWEALEVVTWLVPPPQISLRLTYSLSDWALCCTSTASGLGLYIYQNIDHGFRPFQNYSLVN